MRGLLRRMAVGLLVLVLHALLVSRIVCDGEARRLFAGDLATQQSLADQVAQYVLENEGPTYYETGILRFDGQSAVATDQMALLGLGQIVLAHPELRERYLPAMRAAADRLTDPRQLRYAAQKYGQSGLVRMDAGEGHAYLGYVALGLGMMRRIEPETRHAALHDRLVANLSSRLYASSTGLVETYPGESWPPDVAAVAGAVGLHLTATGSPRPAQLDAWAERFARCAVEPATGWLRQHVRSCGGAPRGSGTAIAGYFLSFSHPDLARKLHDSLAETGQRGLFGFGALREYPAGFSGAGDVDSGPILFGVSVGATGFGLGSARAHGDRPTFVRLYRTTRLFGAAMPTGAGRGFVVGGALGNALLLAMLTAETVP